jgi:hypothetical protein
MRCVSDWYDNLPIDKRPDLLTLNVLYPVIALALDAARRVPEGKVRQGVTDYPLLGTLPLTADGCVVGAGCLPWSIEWEDPVQADDIQIDSCQNDEGGLGNAKAFFVEDGELHAEWIPLSKCYSTRAAAESAKGGG